MEPISLVVSEPPAVALLADDVPTVSLDAGEPAPTSDYSALTNKPRIEGHVLVGDSTIGQIGVGEITAQEIDRLIYG